MKAIHIYYIIFTCHSILLSAICIHGFSIHISPSLVDLQGQCKTKMRNPIRYVTTARLQNHDGLSFIEQSMDPSRRRSLIQMATTIISLVTLTTHSPSSHAAVGTLPEFSDTNAILQGVTVDVTDEEQLQDMISFLQDGFNFQIVRQRTQGTVTDTWMGFGPEQLSIPDDFVYPMSFARYGGHSSIHIRWNSSSTESLYVYSKNLTNITMTTVPGDNVAFLQVAVPSYRISQMIRHGGNVLDAYGIVNVISPCGLPIRGIVGIRPDPIMFLAINCVDVQQSKEFYEQRLGFTQQPYPYARPSNGTGQFEPPQPKGSVYLSPSKNSLGLLLQPYNQDKQGNLFGGFGLGRKKDEKFRTLKANPVLRALNIVYSPLEGDGSVSESTVIQNPLRIKDPSLVPLEFTPLIIFEDQERITRGRLMESV